MKALLLENVHSLAAEILTGAGFDVTTHGGSLDEDELIAALRGVTTVGIRSNTHITERVLSASPQLESIGAFCIGTNQVDLAVAAARGVAVFNAPFSNTRSVVELAVAEIISLARRLTEKDRALHDGVWDKQATGSHEIRGRRLGIVGYGNIGSQLSVVAEMLGMQVFYYDVEDRLAMGNARRCNSLAELLDVAEVVSLHVDGRGANAGFFGEEQFARMRPRSLFLNLSRGFVVDYEALATHIRSGHIAGAAVDVFPTEPKNRGDAFTTPLQGVPNVILTPHIGGSTEEAQVDIGRFVALKLRDYSLLGNTSMSVNLPPVNLRQEPGGSRLAYIHRNVPGVLATVNNLLAEHGVNVEGQFLGTHGDFGYVVIDTHDVVPDAVLAGLRASEVTIRVRHIG
ncbi:D-3-phosphoglycerate dehydrogenase [Austwickia chelonae]|uniref:D-3-phosphoglycerate dehydrogenase n=1 Tax=Austwickia chelonae NBRC 105200 TaxID=1184607 RepID=K6VRE8_9MICO|nr:phosphoglycerate dehydrogenase [Austwickia chelonae]GAB79339.1 D-3-phosphoglycerate dehydrogenase [Austwickia chelonae NBRC 105200]SEW38451.1 D-3-phosphoglycerate dehydrogenase [Austwickia chelonae]